MADITTGERATVDQTPDPEDIDRAHVTVIQPTPAPAITVRKTVGLASGVCADATSILVAPGTPVYFCISVRNTGNVDLARVVFALPPAPTLRVLLLPFFCVAIAQMS